MIEVLLPYYGDPGLMRAAVRSVQKQTTGEWRLTISDDHTQDPDLGDWIRRLDDDRITYTRTPRRLGVSGNFNRCIQLSTGTHLVLMGCDDLMQPTYLERMYEALRRHPGAAAVHPDVAVIDSVGRPARWAGDRVKRFLRPSVDGDRVLSGESFAASLLAGVWTYFPSICWNGAFLRRHRFRSDLETVLDMALLLELALEGERFVLTGDRTFRYRRHAKSASSVTASTSERFEEERALLREMASRTDEMGWDHATRAARRHITSRLHALLLVPAALRSRSGRSAVPALLHHMLAPIKIPPSRVETGQRTSTAERWYAERLEDRASARWKKALDVQRPYRWMLGRLDLGRTLDVGCGVGRNLAVLDRRSVGVDHNVHAVQVARRDGLNALSVDEWRLSPCNQPHAFDTLLLAHVIEHMTAEDASALINNYLPALRPGGRVVVICPQERGFRSDPTHVQYFSKNDMASLLTHELGLQPVREWSFPLPAFAGRAFTYNESWVVAEKVDVPA